MDTISKSYLKQITKKQLKSLRDEKKISFNAIKKGIDKISVQYERLLKHLRVHSEVFVNSKELKNLAVGLRSYMNTWLENSGKQISDILKTEEKQDLSILQIKDYYDKILNLDTCRCLLGLSPIEKNFKGRSVSAFERFSRDFEFLQENLTQKFTKSDIENLYDIHKDDIKARDYRIENNKDLINYDTTSERDNCYGVIYLLTDTNMDGTLPNKMHYIGVTIRKLRRRFLEHLRSTENRYLKKAFSRYHKDFKVYSKNENFSSTKGSEFTIEVIDTANNFIELGEKEKNFIDKYKTYIYDHHTLVNNEPMPLYGYNLTRGGFSRPALYGFLSPKYICVPINDFKKLITLGYRTEEIACEFNIGLSTVHAKIIEYWGDQGINNINSARKAFGGWDSFKSRGNIDVDLEELIKLVEDGAFMHEICDKLHISRTTVTHRLEQLGASDLTHARFIFGGMEIYKKRLEDIYEQTLIKYSKGDLNYQYVPIPEDELKKLVEKGFNEYKIAKLYHTTNITVRTRVKEHWGITFFEAVLLFRIFKKIDESYLERLIKERLLVEEIEKLFYIKLISIGYTPTSISKFFSFKRPAISTRIKKTLGMTFNEAQDIYFYKPKIITAIKNGAKNSSDIASFLNVNSHTIVSHMKRIWHSELLKLYDSDYPKNSPRHFYNLFQYLIQFYLGDN